MKSLKSIRLRIAEKLKDRGYRQRFFRNVAQDELAEQIRSVRLKRELKQKDVAQITGMKPSAVSRLEQAEYARWSLPTLWRIADALDARIRVIFEPAEDAIKHYERLESASTIGRNTALENQARRAAYTFYASSDPLAELLAGSKGFEREVEKGRGTHRLQISQLNIERRLMTGRDDEDSFN